MIWLVGWLLLGFVGALLNFASDPQAFRAYSYSRRACGLEVGFCIVCGPLALMAFSAKYIGNKFTS